MTDMKAFYEKIGDMIKENLLPPVKEKSKDIVKRIALRVCLFCNSAEIQMMREIEDGLFVETFHCPDCKENWTTTLNVQTGDSKVYRHCLNWVDLWYDLINS